MRSLFRIVLGVGAGLLLLGFGLGALFRQPTFGKDRVAGLPRADPEILRRHVEYLTGPCHPRSVENPAGLNCAANYIRQVFETSGRDVEEQVFSARGDSYRNLIVRFGPQDAELTIIGAHYDSFGLFGPNPGADDNASGTAGLLELARLFGEHAPPSRVELVAFANEEPPFFATPHMGSAVHARSLRTRDRPAVAMICLEMIGYFTEYQPWPSHLHRWLFPARGDFIAIVGRLEDRRLARRLKRAFRGATTVPAYSFSAPRWMPDLDASDHRNYWAEGIPSVMITDTAFLRNPHYHSPGDTAATLDYSSMSGVVDGVMNALSLAPEE